MPIIGWCRSSTVMLVNNTKTTKRTQFTGCCPAGYRPPSPPARAARTKNSKNILKEFTRDCVLVLTTCRLAGIPGVEC
jgi:hypothetical protein